MRPLAHALALAFPLLLTVMACLYWGLGTEPGARWLVNQARAWVPGFSVARVEGVLLGRFTLQGLDYRNATDRLRLERLELRLEPAELWRGVLRISSFQIRKPQFSTTDDTPIDWPNLKLPFDLVIDELKVNDASLKLAGDEQPTRLERLEASLSLTPNGLDIRRFAWVMPDLTGELAGNLAMGGMQQVKLKASWNWHPRGRPAFRGEGHAGGNLDRVLIRQSLEAPLPAELSMVLTHPLARLQWTAQLDVPEFLPTRIDPAWPAWPVRLSVQGEGTETAARIAGNALAKIPGVGTAHGDFQSRYHQPGEWVIETLALTLPETRATLALRGTAAKLHQQPEFNVVAEWHDLTWPLGKNPEWRSPRGKLSVTGKQKDLRFAAEGLLADQPVTASGTLGLLPGHTEFRGVRAEGAGLDLQLDGVLGPQVSLSWALRGDRLGVWLPGAQGQLNSRGNLQGPRESPSGNAEVIARNVRYRDAAVREFLLRIKGGLTPGAPPIEAELSAQGLRYDESEANQLRMAFKGGLVLRDGRPELTSPSAELNLAGAGLRYQSHAVREIDLKASGGLSAGSPPIEGTLRARDLRSGELAANDLNIEFKGGMVYQNGQIVLQGAPLEVRGFSTSLGQGSRQARDLRLDLTAGGQPDSPVSLSVRAPDVRLEGQRWNLALDGRGTRAQHTLAGRLDGEIGISAKERLPASLLLRAEGGWAAGVWSGRVSQLDGALEGLGDWRLNRAPLLRIGQGGGDFGPACWEDRAAEACLQGKADAAGGWQMAARISGFALDRLPPWLRGNTTLKGVLNADAQASGQGDRLTDGQFEMAIASALIAPHGEQTTLGFRPEPLVLRGMVTGRGAELRLTAEQIGFASLRAELELEGPMVLSRLRQLPLAGEAHLELWNIGVLKPWMTDIEKLQGRLTAGVRIAGTAILPRFQVHGTLFDAGFSVPRLGIKVRSLNADAISAEGNQLMLTGRAVSGSGEIRLDGRATLSPRDDWPLELTLRGKRFLAADLPEARVYLSPDLLIEHKASRLSLTGKLSIPEATIKIPDESGAIKPSRDVIIVNGDEPPAVPANPLETRVTVLLGDKIEVTGPGYRARVDGQVTVEQAPGGDALGTGEIRIHGGRYSLYGIDLDVNGGRLVFARSAMDNPNLDIQAVRKADDVVVGARLLGTLNKPNITLFSDRPMSQNDILAYLVMGKTLDPLAQDEGSVMKGAASALGGSAGSVLAKELSSRLGLGSFVDISMQSSLGAGGLSQPYGGSEPWGSTQGTALFLGKYLTPKIYVQYGMGLFQNAYVFRLRYDLTQRWKVQTETGEFSGGDILYQWEN